MLAMNDIFKNVLKEQAVLGLAKKSNVRSEILTYILMESAHWVTYNTSLKCQNFSDLSSPVRIYPQTWARERGEKEGIYRKLGEIQHISSCMINMEFIEISYHKLCKCIDFCGLLVCYYVPLSNCLLFIDAHVEEHGEDL